MLADNKKTASIFDPKKKTQDTEISITDPSIIRLDRGDHLVQ